GQKAIEKLTPIINEPVFPLLSFIGILLEILLMIFSLIYPNKNIPTKIRSGPITFRKNGNKIVIFSSKFWPSIQTSNPNPLKTAILPRIKKITSPQYREVCKLLLP